MTDGKCRETGLLAEPNTTHLVHTWTDFSGDVLMDFEAKAAANSSQGQPGDPHNVCGSTEYSLTPEHDLEYCGEIAAAITTSTLTTLTTTATTTTTTMFKFANHSDNSEFMEAFTNCLLGNQLCSKTNTGTGCCPPNIEHWDVSKFTSFKRASNVVPDQSVPFSFKNNLSLWDVTKVTNFENLFSNYLGFDGDISGWKPSAATSMAYMFQRAKKFSGDINGWSMRLPIKGVFKMFYQAESFGGGGDGLSRWGLSDTAHVITQDQLENLFNAFDGTGCDVMVPQANQPYEQPTPGTYCGMQVAAPPPAPTTPPRTTRATTPTPTPTPRTPTPTDTVGTATAIAETTTATTTPPPTPEATPTPNDTFGTAIIHVDMGNAVCNSQSSSSLNTVMNATMHGITNYASCSARCLPAMLKARRSLLAATGDRAIVEARYTHAAEGDDRKLASALEVVLAVGSEHNITVGNETYVVTVTAVVVNPAPKYAKSDDTELVDEPWFIVGMVALAILLSAIGIGVAKKVIDGKGHDGKGYHKVDMAY